MFPSASDEDARPPSSLRNRASLAAGAGNDPNQFMLLMQWPAVHRPPGGFRPAGCAGL